MSDAALFDIEPLRHFLAAGERACGSPTPGQAQTVETWLTTCTACLTAIAGAGWDTRFPWQQVQP